MDRILVIVVKSCDEVSGWGGWSTCTVTCETGTQYRTRTCCSTWNLFGWCIFGNRYNDDQYQDCNTQCCPVNGAWGNWGSYGACSVTCEGGIQYRDRSCDSPAAYCGGSICAGCNGPSCSYTDTSSQTCNEDICCPVDGGWETWREWYSCPVTCGGGTQYRYRYCTDPVIYCNGAICPDCEGEDCGDDPQKDTDPRTCNTLDCNVCGNREIGYGSPSSYTANIGGSTGFGVLAESGFYEATCCGIVKTWEFYASRSGELHLLVWRKSGTTYTLAGENIYIVPSNAVGKTITYTLRELDHLSLEDGDIIGWYTSGLEIIPYSSSDPQNFRMTTMTAVEEGNTYDWSSVAYTHDRAYAIRVHTDDDTAPFYTNLDREVVIFDEEPSGTTIYRVKYYNGDTRDTLTVTYTSSSTDFAFSTVTNFVYLTTSPTVGTYNMTFSLEDSCGNRDSSKTLTIKVLNTPPRITSLPSSAVLHEDVTESQLLHTLDVYDRQTSDSITCVLTSETPNNGNFQVDLITGTTDYGIYLKSKPTFDYEAHTKHTLVISCDDGKGNTGTGDFFVHVLKNHPPRFLNLQASVDLNVTTTLIGDLVYNIQMTDDENDTLTFTMTTDPSGGPFSIHGYGYIATTADLTTIFEPAYNLEVSVNDGRTTVGPRTLAVHLTNINDVPQLGNLPLTERFRIEENSLVGTTLYHVEVRDQDDSIPDVLVYALFSPNTGAPYFSMSSDGYLTISGDIDFESVPHIYYRIVITATDRKDTTTATILVTITDQNEAPSFHQTGYSVEQFESVQGTSFPVAGFIIDDPDDVDDRADPDSHTYWLDCGNDTWRFTMATDTGEITYAYDYDVDKLLTTQYDCVVRAKDTGFNTCTATLVIKIKDVNDNAPYFNQTQFAFYISPYENVSTEIGNVTAYDIDISDYGRISYYLNQTAYDKTYIQINDTGILYVNEILSNRFQWGDVMYLNLTATDYGGLFTTVEVWIVFPALDYLNLGIINCHYSPYSNTPSSGRVISLIGKHDHITLRKKPAGKSATENSKPELDDKKNVKKKLESVNLKRPPGNPLFNKGNNSKPKGSNSVHSSVSRNSVFELKTIPSQSSSQPSLNTSLTSNDTSRNSLKPVSDISLSSHQGNSNLYKAKEELQSGDQGLL
ncbi:HMCN [Mytilus coruscus]|uniref:HMCN n=1 Tax=Mytilus coruscus TaxID=42192 RepID=A0A6J8BVM8_MYTCO|nr:HMCN [Mytilus coruscus]